MARIKFGSVVTEGSGKLAGHVFQNSHGGAQLRTKPIPGGKATSAQILIRSINPILQKGWRDLTNAQRKVWNDWPAANSIMTVRDPHKPISGHDLWMKYNFSWKQAGGDFLPDPSYWGGPILGPELIKNGGFDSGLYWLLEAPWSISLGKAHYNDTSIKSISQSVSIPSGISVLVKFDIFNAVGNCELSFYSSPSGWFLSVPFWGPFLRPNGHYEYTVNVINSATRFFIYGYTGGSAFSLDNVSIRKII